MKLWIAVTSSLLTAMFLVLALLTARHRILWVTNRVTIKVDGVPIPDAHAYVSDGELLVHLERDRPHDLYFINRSSHEMGAEMAAYFTVTRFFIFSRHEPGMMCGSLGKLDRPDPLFAGESVSFHDWEDRSVAVKW